MGTWGAGPFEEDSSADFLAGFAATGVDALRTTFAEALDAPADAYLEIDTGAPVRAAAELVAAAIGHPAALPPSATEALEPHAAAIRAEADLPALATRAVRRVATSPETSELADLWHEREDDAATFDAAIADLLARLGR